LFAGSPVSGAGCYRQYSAYWTQLLSGYKNSFTNREYSGSYVSFLQGPVYNLGENAAVVHILSIGTTSNITSSKHVYNSSKFCPNLLETLGLLVPTRNERHFTLFSIEQPLKHNRLHSMGTKTFTTTSVVLPSVLETTHKLIILKYPNFMLL
jgi:hypothetical protein